MGVTLKTLPAVTVATSGTEVRVSTSPIEKCVKLWISSAASNTGAIYIGDPSVSTTVGVEVPKGTTQVIYAQGEFIDVQNIWIDAANSNDKALIAYLQKNT